MLVGGIGLLLAGAGCSTVRGVQGTAPTRDLEPVSELDYTTLDSSRVRVEPGERTVESSFILDLYTWFHRRDYQSYRVTFPGGEDQEVLGHMLVPAGERPRPALIVFPILAGSHVVSEALAKALVNRGFVVLRLERKELDLEETADPAGPAREFRAALLDARRALDWLVQRPEVDPARIGAAGISLGGILAATLLGVDDRVRAAALIMTGGGLAEILHDSRERPIRSFRDRVQDELGLEGREQFVAELARYTTIVDPLTYADRITPQSVLLVSGRFDRVIPPEQAHKLWEALGQPTWIRLPVGHYQFFPFFWWAVGRGADHLERALGSGTPLLGAEHPQAEPQSVIPVTGSHALGPIVPADCGLDETQLLGYRN
ncbi:MAG: acetylxylan esterase [Myxococcota bacterium]